MLARSESGVDYEDSAELVEHPMTGCIETFLMLLRTTHHFSIGNEVSNLRRRLMIKFELNAFKE